MKESPEVNPGQQEKFVFFDDLICTQVIRLVCYENPTM
jgi:hypothetical protein